MQKERAEFKLNFKAWGCFASGYYTVGTYIVARYSEPDKVQSNSKSTLEKGHFNNKLSGHWKIMINILLDLSASKASLKDSYTDQMQLFA